MKTKLLSLLLLFFFSLSLSSCKKAPESVKAVAPVGLSVGNAVELLPVLQPGTMLRQQSSYARDGGWKDSFMNEGDNRLLLNVEGPGIVNRMWFTGLKETSRLRFYFDGEEFPRIDMKVSDLFAGTSAPFLAPLTGNRTVSSGGYYSYYPIPFSKSLKVYGDQIAYYNMGYYVYPHGTVLKSFDPAQDVSPHTNLLRKQGTLPVSAEGMAVKSGTVSLTAGESKKIFSAKGKRCISQIKLKIPGLISKTEVIEDNGRTHTGGSSFRAKTDPDNQGVKLEKRIDGTLPLQSTIVMVDGRETGRWYAGSEHTGGRFLNSSYEIPAEYTAGKSEITIEMRPISGSAARVLSEFHFWVYSKKGEEFHLTDTLDVGEETEEEKHAYEAKSQVWEGTHHWTYLRETLSEQMILQEDLLNQTSLQIYWNGESIPSVDAPLGSFFGMGQFGVWDAQSLMFGLDDAGSFYFYFPMPFEKSCRITLTYNGKDQTGPMTYEIGSKPFHYDFENIGYFKTQLTQVKSTEKGKPVNILKEEGQGHLAGIVQSVAGAGKSRNYLEGDEIIYIDGSKSHAVHGTGTEDLYNGGFYFDNGLFSLPLHGNPANDCYRNRDRTSMYRIFLYDSIPFRSEISMTAEHGFLNDSVGAFQTILAFYYHKPEKAMTLSDSFAVQNAADRGEHRYTVSEDAEETTFKGRLEGAYIEETLSYQGFLLQKNDRSAFTLKIDPKNNGVVLRRFTGLNLSKDALLRISVTIDGKAFGVWNNEFETEGFGVGRYDDLFLPESFTKGKSELRIEIENISDTHAYADLYYEAYSLTG